MEKTLMNNSTFIPDKQTDVSGSSFIPDVSKEQIIPGSWGQEYTPEELQARQRLVDVGTLESRKRALQAQQYPEMGVLPSEPQAPEITPTYPYAPSQIALATGLTLPPPAPGQFAALARGALETATLGASEAIATRKGYPAETEYPTEYATGEVLGLPIGPGLTAAGGRVLSGMGVKGAAALGAAYGAGASASDAYRRNLPLSQYPLKVGVGTVIGAGAGAGLQKFAGKASEAASEILAREVAAREAGIPVTLDEVMMSNPIGIVRQVLDNWFSSAGTGAKFKQQRIDALLKKREDLIGQGYGSEIIEDTGFQIKDEVDKLVKTEVERHQAVIDNINRANQEIQTARQQAEKESLLAQSQEQRQLAASKLYQIDQQQQLLEQARAKVNADLNAIREGVLQGLGSGESYESLGLRASEAIERRRQAISQQNKAAVENIGEKLGDKKLVDSIPVRQNAAEVLNGMKGIEESLKDTGAGRIATDFLQGNRAMVDVNLPQYQIDLLQRTLPPNVMASINLPSGAMTKAQAVNAIEKLSDLSKTSEAASMLVNPVIQSYKDAIQNPKYDWNALWQMKSELGRAIWGKDSGIPPYSPHQAKLIKLYDSITGAMEDHADKLGAGKLFRDFRSKYADEITFQKDIKSTVKNLEKDPASVIDEVFGSKTLLEAKQFRRAAGAQIFNSAKSKWQDDVLQRAIDTSGNLNGTRINGILNKYNQEVLNQIAPNEVKYLRELAQWEISAREGAEESLKQLSKTSSEVVSKLRKEHAKVSGEAEQLFAEANKPFKYEKDISENPPVANPLFKRIIASEGGAANVVDLAVRPNKASVVKYLRSNITENAFENLGRAFLEKNLPVKDGVISHSAFTNMVNRYGEDVLSELLGRNKFNELNKIASVLSDVKQMGRLDNYSRSATVAGGTAGLSGIIAAMHLGGIGALPQVIAGEIVVPYIGAKLYYNDLFRRGMVSLLTAKSSAEYTAQARYLNKIIETETKGISIIAQPNIRRPESNNTLEDRTLNHIRNMPAQ